MLKTKNQIQCFSSASKRSKQLFTKQKQMLRRHFHHFHHHHRHNGIRHCATSSFDTNSTTSGMTGRGPFGSVLRLLGLTAAFAVGSFTIIIVSWPILDAIAMPRLFKRAVFQGTHQFDDNPIMSEALVHEYDRVQVKNLAQLLFPASSSPQPEKEEKSHEKRMQDVRDEYHNSSVVVLTGPPGSNKSEIARRVALHRRGGEENDSAESPRPVLYMNLRGYVDSATFLHGTLTYLLVPTLGLLGKFVHAYIKLLNASIDILTMNNSHEYNSFIFFAMTMGHLRSAFFKIRDQNIKSGTQDNKPLVIIDHVEQLLQNNDLFGKDSAINLMAQMMMTFLLRSALDEKVCNILIVTDSSALTNKYDFASESSSSLSSKKFGGNNKRANASSCSATQDFIADFGRGGCLRGDDYLMSSSSLSDQHDASSSSSSTVATSDLMQVFPALCQRAKFAYAVPRRIFPRLQVSKNLETNNNNLFHESSSTENIVKKYQQEEQQMSNHVCEKLLQRACSNSNCPPPLLVGWVASLLLEHSTSAGVALDAGSLAQLTDRDQSSVWECLVALEEQGLADRVVGSSLLFPSEDESQEYLLNAKQSNYNTALAVPGFLASETLRKMSGKQILENTFVEIRIPLRNQTDYSKKFSNKSKNQNNNDHLLPTPSTSFKTVRLPLFDSLDRNKVLLKISAAALSATSGKSIEQSTRDILSDCADGGTSSSSLLLWNGFVLPQQGNTIVSSADDFSYFINSLRNGEIVTPSKLPRSEENGDTSLLKNRGTFGDENVIDSTIVVATDEMRSQKSWKSLIIGTSASFVVGASMATAIGLFANHLGLIKMSM